MPAQKRLIILKLVCFYRNRMYQKTCLIRELSLPYVELTVLGLLSFEVVFALIFHTTALSQSIPR